MQNFGGFYEVESGEVEVINRLKVKKRKEKGKNLKIFFTYKENIKEKKWV